MNEYQSYFIISVFHPLFIICHVNEASKMDERISKLWVNEYPSVLWINFPRFYFYHTVDWSCMVRPGIQERHQASLQITFTCGTCHGRLSLACLGIHHITRHTSQVPSSDRSALTMPRVHDTSQASRSAAACRYVRTTQQVLPFLFSLTRSVAVGCNQIYVRCLDSSRRLIK